MPPTNRRVRIKAANTVHMRACNLPTMKRLGWILPYLLTATTLSCGGSSLPSGSLEGARPSVSAASIPAPQGGGGRLPSLQPLWESPSGQLASNLVALGDRLFFFRVSDDGPQLVSMPITGGAPSTVAIVSLDLIIANNLPLHDKALYGWADDGLLRLSLTDGKKKTLEMKDFGVASVLVADDSGLFTQQGDVVWRVGFDGARSKLATLPGTTPASGPQSLAIGSGGLWVLTGAPSPTLFHVSTRDGSVLRRVELPVPKAANTWVGAVVADGSGAIVVTSADEKTRITKVGSAEETLFEGAGMLNDLSDVRVDADFLYLNLMHTPEDGRLDWRLVRLSKLNGESTTLQPPPGGEGYEMLEYRGNIYFLGHASGSVWRLAR